MYDVFHSFKKVKALLLIAFSAWAHSCFTLIIRDNSKSMARVFAWELLNGELDTMDSEALYEIKTILDKI